MPTLEQITEALKLAPRYLVAVAIFCGIFLFLPENISKQLGVLEFTRNYRQWLGIAFLACISLLSVTGGLEIIGVIRNRSHVAQLKKRMLQRLQCLTEEEKQILRFYLAQQSKTNTLRTDDGVVNGLVAHGIIYIAANHGNLIEGFAHNINEVAWDYLHEHPELLGGTTNTYRTDRRDRRIW